jgi:acyl carrier protein
VSDIAEKLKGYIAKEIALQDDAAVAEETPLVGDVMDSLGLMQLIAYIEKEFGVTVEDAEVTVENFRTVADIERLVSAKT